MADDSQGGTTPPTTRTDDPAHRGVLTSVHIEAMPVGDLLANGREVGSYIWGYWNRHLVNLPDAWHGTVEVIAEVRREHLAATLTTMVQIGANASVYSDNGHTVEARFYVDVGPAL